MLYFWRGIKLFVVIMYKQDCEERADMIESS